MGAEPTTGSGTTTATTSVISPVPLGTAAGVADWGVGAPGNSRATVGHSTYLGRCPEPTCPASVYRFADAAEDAPLTCGEGHRVEETRTRFRLRLTGPA
ncbi:hypothetical protein ACFFSW_25370 [Saccharothrix longispora]|uniref:Uncharacterized protein n=1 Tax=Saccharothrix longispora TaxID=33920 RepID=A0ABU1PXG8_9PSEU|nr:hypothetical protein [Saccharothrix longispora]MDR6595146.1 hypothetical protein [Saccharothrix longispora]